MERGKGRGGWHWKRFRSRSVRMIMVIMCIIPSRKRDHPSPRTLDWDGGDHWGALKNSMKMFLLRNRPFARRCLSRLVAPLPLTPASFFGPWQRASLSSLETAPFAYGVEWSGVASRRTRGGRMRRVHTHTSRVEFDNFRPHKTQRYI